MSSTKWRRTIKRIRHSSLRIAGDERVRAAILGACVTLFVVAAVRPFLGSSTNLNIDLTLREKDDSRDITGRPSRLFIAIGSAPKNFELREAARASWLKWLDHEAVTYRFFTDAPPASIKSGVSRESRETWISLDKESRSRGDLVFQPLPTGYGDKEHNAYGQRARYQVHWALKQFKTTDFFLRIDDDSFLCLHKLLYELKSLPRRQFFWGRFWCREGRSRADENFMLFSRDVVQLLGDDNYVGKIIPYDNDVTFGWNFGYWSWVFNLTVFDDQERIDSQQGYLTHFMHENSIGGRSEYESFCNKYIYAHHVSGETMQRTFNATKTHLMYHLPTRRAPTETCRGHRRSFLPARHSSALPNLRIEQSDR